MKETQSYEIEMGEERFSKEMRVPQFGKGGGRGAILVGR